MVSISRCDGHDIDRLAFEAKHDSLTGLPNRSFVLERLTAMLSSAPGEHQQVEVLFIDLDHFKLVNDTLGHHAGDVLLTAFAHRLQSVLRPDDLIGRFGGDEFLVAIAVDAREQPSVAGRILMSLAEPFEIAGRPITTSASIGVAISEPGTRTPGLLLQAADTALFEAKRLGRGRAQLFTPELRELVVERVELEADLRAAIGTSQLRLAYQPQIDLNTGRMVGVEALLRWDHPTLGAIGPDRFIPVAEDSRLIGELGRWVLHESCAQMMQWRATSRHAPRSIAVNVSALQLEEPSFVEAVADVLAATGLPAGALCLEVTESVLIGRSNVAVHLGMIRALGCYIGIDDFGTGHSSLGRLRDLPVDVLKIDRSFVEGLGTDPDDSAIVASIMSMALTMGHHVIAEGVEHGHQADALVRLGCQYAQGYLFAPALPPERITTNLRQKLWRPISGEHAAADRRGGPAVSARSTRHGHRRFIDEFLDQIGLTPTPGPAAGPVTTVAVWP